MNKSKPEKEVSDKFSIRAEETHAIEAGLVLSNSRLIYRFPEKCLNRFTSSQRKEKEEESRLICCEFLTNSCYSCILDVAHPIATITAMRIPKPIRIHAAVGEMMMSAAPINSIATITAKIPLASAVILLCISYHSKLSRGCIIEWKFYLGRRFQKQSQMAYLYAPVDILIKAKGIAYVVEMGVLSFHSQSYFSAYFYLPFYIFPQSASFYSFVTQNGGRLTDD